eukprot:TRINITY_DN985_c0_g1_i1.p1 TRINITY_DN985_c0_g1~~TRINITY_DN985_c0_g1_i1.p1  ORF type:complete len:242 (-),score=23.19 TRINITY_DN985_c0_g1_i1:25-750(-)
MMSSPLPTIICCISYLILVLGGIKFMKNRKPFQLTTVLRVHNFLLVILSLYMTIGIGYYAITSKFKWVGNSIDFGPDGLPLAKVLWVFYFSKLVEFVDTFLMVLRKRTRQVSFLHIYHHCSMLSLWWIGIKHAAGGDAYWSAMQNSFVHVVMYSYYLMSSFGIRVWWKKYLTQFQMTQFFINMIHSASAFFVPPSNFPRWMGIAMLGYMVSMLTLFGNFYYQSYRARRNAQREAAKEKKNN